MLLLMEQLYPMVNITITSSPNKRLVKVLFENPGPEDDSKEVFVKISNIDDVRLSNVTAVEENQNIYPNEYILSQNFPNPFSNQTRISFVIKENNTDLNLSVYNTSGHLVISLINERYKNGSYSLTWNGCEESGKKASPGIYFLRLKTERYAETKKITIVK